jgi:nucleotide-binding universal stress UspA family protein
MEKINEIIAAVDTSAMADEVLKRAIAVSREHNADLTVVHAIEVPFMEFPFLESIDEDAVKEKLEARVGNLGGASELTYRVLVKRGAPSEVVTFESERIGADLIVLGSHGKENIESSYFGSTIRKIIQKTHVPALVVKNRADRAYSRMIAPTNLTEYSEKSILFAKSLFAEASMTYLHAYETISEVQAEFYRINAEEIEHLQNKMASYAKIEMEKFMERVGSAKTLLIEKTASVNEDLLEAIREEKPDLVVLGSKGVESLNSFIFGSTATYISQNTPTDVLVYVPEA